MKRLYYLFIIVLLTISTLHVNAQKRGLGKISVMYDTVNVSGSPTEFEIVAYNTIYNTSSGTQTYRWVVLSKDLTTNWDIGICDIVNCYFGIDSQSFTLNKGDSGTFSIHFYPGNTFGTGKVSIYTYPVGSYNEGVTHFYQCNAPTQGVGGNARFDFSMYPNPVKDILTIQFPRKGVHSVEVYNILGRRLMAKEVQNTDRIRLSFANLQKGMYVIMYRTETGKVITKTISKE